MAGAMAKSELGEFKIMIAYMIDELIKDAIAHNAPTEAIFRAIGAESLELAVRIHINHGGCDTGFLKMACDLLDLTRNGAKEQ